MVLLRRGLTQQPAQQPPIARPAPAGARQDINEITNPSVERIDHDPIPAVDFRWTWRNKNQQGFAYTQNSFSAGFDRQRGRLEDIAANIAESSLITHHSNDVTLPLLTESANLDYRNAGGTYHTWVTSTVFQGRAIWAVPGGPNIFAETSQQDSTPVQILSTYAGPINLVLSLNVMTIDSIECLIVGGSTTLFAFSSIDPPVLHVSNTTISGVSWFQQVSLPKQPILVRYSSEFHLIRSDWGSATPSLSDATKTNTVRSFGSRLVGLGRVGSRPPLVLMIESNGDLSYTDVYGMRYSKFQGIDLPGIHQAAFVREGVAVRDTQRLIYYDGRSWDTRIFRDPVPVSGYSYYLAGFHVVEDTIFAEVNLIPDNLKGSWVDLSGVANIKRQTWRLDFDRLRWSPVSEWTEWVGHSVAPAAGMNPGSVYLDSLFGHISCPPLGPSLPYGPVTRTLHIVCNLEQNLTLRKFEPPPGTSPYSLRDTKLLATDGTTRSAGLIFPKGPGFDATYLDKYIDGVYWGGQDTGGAGSYLRIRIGEWGRLDNTTPLPQTARFSTGVTHEGRFFPFNEDQSLLFPQIEFYINRGSGTMATMQALPVTVIGHVDLEQRASPPRPWHGFGRSKG